MKRRTFFKNGLIAGAATFVGLGLPEGRQALAKASPFNMKFSPDFGLFADVAGKEPEDQIRWGHDNGFHAWECTFCKGAPWKNKTRSAIPSKNLEWISGSL